MKLADTNKLYALQKSCDCPIYKLILSNEIIIKEKEKETRNSGGCSTFSVFTICLTTCKTNY